LERFFRGVKRRGRKKSGTASLNKTLKTILADTPLVRNLEKEEYQKIILNGCSSLAERFSQIDDKIVRDQLKQSEENREKYHRKSKRLSNKRTYHRKFLRFSLGTANLMPTVICGHSSNRYS
jgi:hypothetical protein